MLTRIFYHEEELNFLYSETFNGHGIKICWPTSKLNNAWICLHKLQRRKMGKKKLKENGKKKLEFRKYKGIVVSTAYSVSTVITVFENVSNSFLQLLILFLMLENELPNPNATNS